MKICVIIFNDGRNDYLEQTLKSLTQNLLTKENKKANKFYLMLYDDMPDGRDFETLKRIVKEYNINKSVYSETNKGINLSVQTAWQEVPSDTDYIWHQENDFIFNEPVKLHEMINPLILNPMIGQVALLRQPWYDDEIEAGGLYEVGYRDYRSMNVGGIDLVGQTMFFTHNPSIYRAKHALQIDNYNELGYAKYLMTHHNIKTFCYLGKKSDKPKVEHIGKVKVGKI